MWYNNPISWLVRSPFHRLLDKSVLLIEVRGRKSGKLYSTPVNFVEADNVLWVTSQRERTWWRNLRGGDAVSVVLRGKSYAGQGEAIEDLNAVAHGLGTYLHNAPQAARYFEVGLDPAGHPLAEDRLKAAGKLVMVKNKLDQEGFAS